MEQKARIFELSKKSLKEDQIEFGRHAYCSKTIYKWKAMENLGCKTDEKEDNPGRKVDDQFLKRISEILNEEPFSSARSIVQSLGEDNSTSRKIWLHLDNYREQ